MFERYFEFLRIFIKFKKDVTDISIYILQRPIIKTINILSIKDFLPRWLKVTLISL